MGFFRKVAGTLLVIAAIVGLIFSLGGMFVTWQAKPAITQGLVEAVKVVSATLETTSQALEVTQLSLESSVQMISSLQMTVETIAATVSDSQPMVTSINQLLSEDLPAMMDATYTSLITAQQSAGAIDGVLTTLSSIPLIGIPYNPEVPLGSALGDVADKVSGLPARFIEMSASLDTTSDNLDRFEADLSTMASSIGQIESSVAQYDAVVSGYQQSIAQIQLQLTGLALRLPDIVNGVVWGLTIFLAWMAIAQIGLMTQGWELLTRRTAPTIEEIKAEVREEAEEVQAEVREEEVEEIPAKDEPEAEK